MVANCHSAVDASQLIATNGVSSKLDHYCHTGQLQSSVCRTSNGGSMDFAGRELSSMFFGSGDCWFNRSPHFVSPKKAWAFSLSTPPVSSLPSRSLGSRRYIHDKRSVAVSDSKEKYAPQAVVSDRQLLLESRREVYRQREQPHS